jgi:hypothetical protein
MQGAVELRAEVALAGEGLRVRVAVRNVGAGHHLPTGSPMRNMLLLVEAADGQGTVLPLLSGDRAPAWAGLGSPAGGDHAGLPGRGFAKVLSELVEYPADRGAGRFTAAFPAPYWRPTVVASDTRIPAGATDVSEYRFGLGGATPGPLRVRTRLIYRRTFRSWGRLAALAGEDLQLAASENSVDWPAAPGRKGEGP